MLPGKKNPEGYISLNFEKTTLWFSTATIFRVESISRRIYFFNLKISNHELLRRCCVARCGTTKSKTG